METAPQYVGIDPSLARTAVVNGDALYKGVRIFGSQPSGPLVEQRMIRFSKMACGIVEYIRTLDAQQPVRLVAIETYALGHNNPGTAALCEFGGILRLNLTRAFRLVEVTPSQLKQYVTGKGNTKKPEFISTLSRKYNADFPDEDEYFAYALWLMARNIAEPNLGTKAQQEIAAAVLNPKPKKKKGKQQEQQEPARPF